MYVLTGHGVHTVLPVVLVKEPGGQVAQELAPELAANVPTAQGVHEVEPTAAVVFPAGQSWQVNPSVP